MIGYIVLGLIVLFFNLKIGLTLHYRLRLKRIFKDQLINKNEIIMNGMTYKIHYIPCSKNTQIRVNSYLFIELITPREQKQQLISVNLKHPTLVITSPIVTKLRWVINENEERFLNEQEQVFNSYIIPFDKLSSFKETLS
jgi:hypothetical protein